MLHNLQICDFFLSPHVLQFGGQLIASSLRLRFRRYSSTLYREDVYAVCYLRTRYVMVANDTGRILWLKVKHESY